MIKKKKLFGNTVFRITCKTWNIFVRKSTNYVITYLNGEAMLNYNECLTRQHEDCLILLVLIEIQHLPNQIQK